MHFFVIACCVCLWVFLIEWLCGLFVVVVFVIDFTIDWWDSLSCLFWRFVFLGVFDWEIVWIVCRDCLSWLIVPVGCILLNGCDFVRKKKNKGLAVHCIVAVVKPYVKMSVLRSMRLNFWFGRVLFVVKTFFVLNVVLRAAQVKSFAK